MENYRNLLQQPHSYDKINKVIIWTAADVENWILYIGTQCQIDINGFNATYLHELYLYQKRAPELFYEIVKPIFRGAPNALPIAFIRFSFELKQLFELYLK
jgi:hypothetical protein